MRYFGGKSRTGKAIGEEITRVILENNISSYIEPFIGGGWVMCNVSANHRYGMDICKPLIELYIALKNGWKPPTQVSLEEYKQAQEGKLEPHLQAFIGFGCSFAGKWFGGYARDKTGRNYAENASRSLQKKFKSMDDVLFAAGDYRDLNPSDCGDHTVIYCDPPYQGTTGYAAAGDFDSDEFWTIMRIWSKDHIVIVSEYAAPKDWVCWKSYPTKTDINTKKGKEERLECLFTHESFFKKRP